MTVSCLFSMWLETTALSDITATGVAEFLPSQEMAVVRLKFLIKVNDEDSTKHSPFYLVYGRQPRLPIEFTMKCPGAKDEEQQATMPQSKYTSEDEQREDLTTSSNTQDSENRPQQVVMPQSKIKWM
ncbi:hypothetical protein EMCRGX_G019601 [Ephydatia muelleri]